MVPSDTAPVRRGEEIDDAKLAAYLAPRLDHAIEPLAIRQFPGGHSNLTYYVSAGGVEYVLRRPPLGPVPPKAHDMAREYHVLSQIGPHFAPAPRVFLLCEDAAVLGAPFYLMERRTGVTIRREVPPEIAACPGYARRISEAFIDCLAELHAIDIRRHGLEAIGRPEGFLKRQVRGWSGRWERARTEPLPEMEALSEWLARRMPASQPATIVHNDYKLDNLMLDHVTLDAGDPALVSAVLDWEMTTVGDPLVDLGIVLCYWSEAGDPPMRREAISPVTAQPGWYSRQDLMRRYALASGRDLTDIQYYEVFGLYKLAVVLQQIYYRFQVGQTSDQRFADFNQRVRGLADSAVLVMETR
ncbi:MAG: phosphotransferase family protein [Acidobacteria bacterium]|nr:phosphotransferase family protein [Acidobacteriota bacterium]